MNDGQSLTGSVGTDQRNAKVDVLLVQRLLNQHSHALHAQVAVRGDFDHETQSAIVAFQRKVLRMRHPDGIVGIHGVTIAKLRASSIAPVLVHAKAHSRAGTPAENLSNADFTAAASRLNCEIAARSFSCGSWV